MWNPLVLALNRVKDNINANDWKAISRRKIGGLWVLIKYPKNTIRLLSTHCNVEKDYIFQLRYNWFYMPKCCKTASVWGLWKKSNILGYILLSKSAHCPPIFSDLKFWHEISQSRKISILLCKQHCTTFNVTYVDPNFPYFTSCFSAVLVGRNCIFSRKQLKNPTIYELL